MNKTKKVNQAKDWIKPILILFIFLHAFGLNAFAGTHPADKDINFIMSFDEAINYGVCWKSAPTILPGCPSPAATQGDAVRANTLWNSTFDGRYYFDPTKTCPLCWQPGSAPVDTTPPSTVNLTAPAGGTTVSGTITPSATASDNVGVTKVDFYVDGSILGTDLTSPYSFSTNTTALSNASHAFTARAFDAANNSTLSPAVTVTVNNAVATGPWAIRFGGTGSDGGRAVKVDGSGNIYTAGWFTGTASFQGTSPLTTSLTSAGGQDIYLAKLNSSGGLLWVKKFGGVLNETVTSIALDSNGNIILGGFFTGDPANPTFTANLGGNNFTSAGSQDIFLAQYDSSGVHKWSKPFGGTALDSLNDLAVDSQNNVVITGSFRNTISFDNGTTSLPSIFGGDTGFLAKFSPSGVHMRSKRFDGGSSNSGQSIAVDSSDKILVTGYFNLSINLGGGQLNAGAPASSNIYIAKFSPTDYTVLWSTAHGINTTMNCYAIAVDSNDDVVISGTFNSQTDLDGPESSAGNLTGPALYTEIFVAKYAATNGALRWARGSQGSNEARPARIATDAQNNVVVTGYYKGTFNFAGSSLSSLVGQNDVFVGRFSSSGAGNGTETFGGTGADQSYGLAVDPAGFPVVTGIFSTNATFGTQTLTSAGSYDSFVMKLAP